MSAAVWLERVRIMGQTKSGISAFCSSSITDSVQNVTEMHVFIFIICGILLCGNVWTWYEKKLFGTAVVLCRKELRGSASAFSGESANQ